jgi:hypothetical protein
MRPRGFQTLGRLAILVGLSITVLASPRDERTSFARSPSRRSTPLPQARRSATPTPRAYVRFATLGGGDTCAMATAISALPFSDSGTTVGKADDNGNTFLQPACSEPDGVLSRPGPDVF